MKDPIRPPSTSPDCCDSPARWASHSPPDTQHLVAHRDDMKRVSPDFYGVRVVPGQGARVCEVFPLRGWLWPAVAGQVIVALSQSALSASMTHQGPPARKIATTANRAAFSGAVEATRMDAL
jgi:hypothetical protein